MKNILYIGNKLAQHGRTETTIDSLGPLLKKEGYELRYASSIKNISKRMLHMMRMTFINRNWADVVLIDTYSTKNFWYAITIARLCKSIKLKYIPILHGGNLPERLIKNPKRSKNFLKNAHFVVSPSDYIIAEFEKSGYTEITKINNFIQLDNYAFKERAQLKPNLLWVRSFAEIYNPIMAIQVFEEICKKYPDATLTMVGPEKDGSLKKCKLLAKELALEVNFTGLLSKENWIKWSKQHDIFINTTHFDNLPVSLLESMALGLPIVSTDVGGIPYLIKHKVNGLLVPDVGIKEMAASIDYLLTHPQEVAAITSCARNNSINYSWKEVKQQWDKLLQS